MKSGTKKPLRPAQRQRQPGLETEMTPRPKFENDALRGSGKLQDRVAIITGGDSGIGRAVAVAFAKEGADVVINYLEEENDARETRQAVEKHGRRCVLHRGDIGSEGYCKRLIAAAIKEYGRLDILVNNAAEQHVQAELEKITAAQLERTFRTNIFSFFFLTREALPHLKEGASIINTSSVTAYRGSAQLLDYSATKGAIVSFTRSLALNLAERKIRVNAVAPGPIWTPLIPATMPEEKVKTFGSDVPLGRAGEPAEVAPAYVFLASEEGSYFTGQVLHPNGGEVVNA